MFRCIYASAFAILCRLIWSYLNLLYIALVMADDVYEVYVDDNDNENPQRYGRPLCSQTKPQVLGNLT